MKNDSMQEAIFAPVLYSTNVAEALEFYTKAFGAKELRKWSNDDGSVHVAEMTIGTSLFHLHEEVPRCSELSPKTLGGTPVIIGLFVSDPDSIMAKAIAAGAIETNAMQDYDYGYGREVSPIPLAIIGLFKRRYKKIRFQIKVMVLIRNLKFKRYY